MRFRGQISHGLSPHVRESGARLLLKNTHTSFLSWRLNFLTISHLPVSFPFVCTLCRPINFLSRKAVWSGFFCTCAVVVLDIKMADGRPVAFLTFCARKISFKLWWILDFALDISKAIKPPITGHGTVHANSVRVYTERILPDGCSDV